MNRAVLGFLITLACTGSAVAAVAPALVTVKVDERPALELMELIAAQCQSGISADPLVLERLAQPISFSLKQVSWEHARNVIAGTLDLELSLSGGLLHVTTTRHAWDTGRLATRYYNVASLIRQSPSHDALPLDLTHTLEDSTVITDRFPTEHSDKPELNEVIEVIQRLVEPRSWESEGVAIEQMNSHLVISNTPTIHAQVVVQLAHQEAMVQRQCVCRVYRLGDLPSGTNAVLTKQEWATLAPQIPPPAAVFLAHNAQCQRHFAGLQRVLIIDADQNQYQPAPRARVVSTGLSLSLTPTIMVDAVRVQTRLWATVDAQYTHQTIVDEVGQPLVTITTPHLTMDQADDLREIPFGGAAIYRFGERSYAITVEVVDLPGLKR